jgi:hypothetical protein
MELFPAADEDQFEFIKRIIDDCDYYLLIIGGRYGTLTAKGISYTEQEYEYALERQLKVIALLHKNPDQLPLAKSEQKPKLRAQLNAFRKKVSKGRLVEFWQNEGELPGIVALSLPKTIKMFPAVGWVRADKVSSEELLTEINELRKQNALMKEKLAETELGIFTVSEEKDFSYIYERLDRFENVIVRRLVSVKLEETISYSVNLASLIAFIFDLHNHKYSWIAVSKIILKYLSKEQKPNTSVDKIQGLDKELLRYGLLKMDYLPSTSNVAPPGFRESGFVLDGKLERYKYWLEVNGKMPERVEIREISDQPE